MTKLIAITDTSGKVVGTVPAEVVRSEGVTIQARPHPKERKNYQYLEVEVADELARSSPEDLHKALNERMKGIAFYGAGA